MKRPRYQSRRRQHRDTGGVTRAGIPSHAKSGTQLMIPRCSYPLPDVSPHSRQIYPTRRIASSRGKSPSPRAAAGGRRGLFISPLRNPPRVIGQAAAFGAVMFNGFVKYLDVFITKLDRSWMSHYNGGDAPRTPQKKKKNGRLYMFPAHRSTPCSWGRHLLWCCNVKLVCGCP